MDDVRARIQQELDSVVSLHAKVRDELGAEIAKAAELTARCLGNGGQVLLFGNGGSAADAQHLAGELVGRFLKERAPLPAVALSTNTSVLTCIGNDYGFDNIFERQVRALGRPGDLAWGISTSGNSPNVLSAFECAWELGLSTLGMTGGKGGKMAQMELDCLINIPVASTPHIQEGHITVGHLVCMLVEEMLFPDAKGDQR